MSLEPTIEAENRRKPWFRRLPVVSHYNKSVGLQRGMLVGGLVLTAVFLLTAVFAPFLAPYGFSQLSDATAASQRRRHREANTCGALRLAATTSCRG